MEMGEERMENWGRNEELGEERMEEERMENWERNEELIEERMDGWTDRWMGG